MVCSICNMAFSSEWIFLCRTYGLLLLLYSVWSKKNARHVVSAICRCVYQVWNGQFLVWNILFMQLGLMTNSKRLYISSNCWGGAVLLQKIIGTNCSKWGRCLFLCVGCQHNGSHCLIVGVVRALGELWLNTLSSCWFRNLIQQRKIILQLPYYRT